MPLENTELRSRLLHIGIKVDMCIVKCRSLVVSHLMARALMRDRGYLGLVISLFPFRRSPCKEDSADEASKGEE
jgi:hypothetical protein